MKKILYIGRFELPDKEATANRVIANAKLFRDLGYDVVLAGWSDEISSNGIWEEKEFFGFKCFEKRKAKTSYEKYKMFVDARPEISLLKQEKYDIVLAYDFPAVALKKIIKFCKKHDIQCFGDVSEWYTNKNKNPFFRGIRAYDSYLRMKVLHKKMDGLIVISRYLENYYANCKTVYVPPLVDLNDEKWNIPKGTHEGVKFIYAGWPSRTKERLDIIVNAIFELSNEYNVFLDIYGINEKQYKTMYKLADNYNIAPCIRFHGRVSHKETISAVTNADYTILIRESSRKNNAGFPSKLVESITCGTPVLCTDISNVKEYVSNGKNGFIISQENLINDIKQAIEQIQTVTVSKKTFDYKDFFYAEELFIYKNTK